MRYAAVRIPYDFVVQIPPSEREARRKASGPYSISWEGHGLRQDLHDWFVEKRRHYRVQASSGMIGTPLLYFNSDLRLMYKLTWGGK